MSEEDVRTIVIDLGSDTIKAGFAGDDEPRYVFQCTDRRRIYDKSIMDFSVGSRVVMSKSVDKLTYPIVRGVVNDWDYVEKIFDYTFYRKLNVDPRNHSVLITGAPFTSKHSRMALMQLIFETFYVSSFYCGNPGVFSLYSMGRTTGVNVDI